MIKIALMIEAIERYKNTVLQFVMLLKRFPSGAPIQIEVKNPEVAIDSHNPFLEDGARSPVIANTEDVIIDAEVPAIILLINSNTKLGVKNVKKLDKAKKIEPTTILRFFPHLSANIPNIGAMIAYIIENTVTDQLASYLEISKFC